MSSDNLRKFMISFSEHITNLNHALKGPKLDIIVDFIWVNYKDLIITTNKVTFSSDISVIGNYLKNINNIDSNNVQNAHLSQSKLYLKILGIPYLLKGTNTPINSSVVKTIIKLTHIFNEIKVASKPHVVKVSSKSDIAIIWIDIWNF